MSRPLTISGTPRAMLANTEYATAYHAFSMVAYPPSSMHHQKNRSRWRMYHLPAGEEQETLDSAVQMTQPVGDDPVRVVHERVGIRVRDELQVVGGVIQPRLPLRQKERVQRGPQAADRPGVDRDLVR